MRRRRVRISVGCQHVGTVAARWHRSVDTMVLMVAHYFSYLAVYLYISNHEQTVKLLAR
jgi:hypothetical protein